MIIGRSVLRGAGNPQIGYFGYRASMMGGFTRFGAVPKVGSPTECISVSTTVAACLQCCSHNFTSAQRRACKRDCESGYGQTTGCPAVACPEGKVCDNGVCVDANTGTCNKVCTSPCSTGQPEDCCHYECPPGVQPPPEIVYQPYPVGGGGGGIINTTTGETFGSSESSSPNWLLIGGLAAAAFFVGKSMFGAKQ